MLVLAEHADRAIQQQLAGELDQVAQRFEAELVSDLTCVNQLVEHVRGFRGKMLRPMLVLVSAMACAREAQQQQFDGEQQDRMPGVNDQHRTLATVVEMVHMATLVHDDVLDEADVRRNGATISALRGNEAAVMLGDYLISHAYRLCSSLDQQWIAQSIADTTNTVCEGELLQLHNRHNVDLDEATYFDIIHRKTASLCGVCCSLGAALADAPEHMVSSLLQYGEKVGKAFQIVDDLLDLVGDASTVGKSVRRDLGKGKLTLPLIHHLTHSSAQQKSRIKALLGRTDLTAGQSAQVQQALAQSGSLDYARAHARRLIDDARALTTQLPPSPARDLLSEMAEAVVRRKF